MTDEVDWEAIAALPDDWDSYGGVAPTAETIETAKRVHALLGEGWDVGPVGNGSIDFERHGHGAFIIICVKGGPRGASVAIRFKEDST